MDTTPESIIPDKGVPVKETIGGIGKPGGDGVVRWPREDTGLPAVDLHQPEPFHEYIGIIDIGRCRRQCT